MASPEIEEYVREQLKAGYSPEEIRGALLSQGWTEQEAGEVLGIDPAGEFHHVSPPVKIKSRRNIGFIISLLGGLIIFIFGLESVLELQLISSVIVQAGLVVSFTGFLEPVLQTTLNIGTVILIFAIVTMMGSLLINKSGRGGQGAVLVLVFSVLTIAGFNGFLVLLGGILGIIGAVLGTRSA